MRILKYNSKNLFAKNDNSEKRLRLVVTIAKELADKASNLPTDKMDYSDNIKKLSASLLDLFDTHKNQIQKLIHCATKAEIYREFAECLWAFTELTEKGIESHDLCRKTLQQMPSGIEKKQLIHAAVETSFKVFKLMATRLCSLGETNSSFFKWYTQSIQKCNDQINKKEIMVTIIAYSKLWSLARILIAPSRSYSQKFAYLATCFGMWKAADNLVRRIV